MANYDPWSAYLTGGDSVKALSEDVRRLLDEHDWNDTIPRLLRYAMNKIRKMHWYQKAGGQVAAGKMAEDFVMEAIIKVYQGERRWDPKSFPDLLSYLFGVLRSEIGHQSQSLENRSVMFLEAASDKQKYKIDYQLSSNTNPAIEEEFLKGFINSLQDEKDLVEMVGLITSGLKPKQIAKEMQVEPSVIYNLRKVLKRRYEKYLNLSENN